MTILLTDEYVNIPWDDIVRVETNFIDKIEPFTIAWVLGRFCNYSCSYCYDFAHSNKVDHFSLQIYKDTVSEIKRQARQNSLNAFSCNFSGGEPTAYKDFLELIRFYCDDDLAEYNKIIMTTNLSPPIKWWNRWIDATKNSINSRIIIASFHREFAKNDEFTEKLLMLKEAGVEIEVNQVMQADLFYEALERIEKWHELGISVVAKPQKCKSGNEVLVGSYTEEMLEILKKGFPSIRSTDGKIMQGMKLTDKNGNIFYIDQSERLNSLQKNVFTGWSCEAGYKSVVIKGNSVVRAHSCSNIKLGTVTEGFTLFDKSLPCVSSICITSTDTKLTKWRDLSKNPIGSRSITI